MDLNTKKKTLVRFSLCYYKNILVIFCLLNRIYFVFWMLSYLLMHLCLSVLITMLSTSVKSALNKDCDTAYMGENTVSAEIICAGE